MALGALLPAGVLAALFLLGTEVGPIGRILLGSVLTQGLAFGGVALAQLRRLTPQQFAERVGTHRPNDAQVRAAFSGCALALCGSLVGGAVAAVLGVNPADNRVLIFGNEQPLVFLLMMPVSMLLIGPGEELLFRGIIQTRLRDTFSAPVAVALASLIFAGVHVFALDGSWFGRLITVGILLLPSLVFGILYERHKNVWVPALAHGLYDVALFALAYTAAKHGVLLDEVPAGFSSLAWLQMFGALSEG